jgi:hypothetical protein
MCFESIDELSDGLHFVTEDRLLFVHPLFQLLLLGVEPCEFMAHFRLTGDGVVHEFFDFAVAFHFPL